MTRSEFLAIVAAATAVTAVSWGQESGMASRGVRPQPRGKISGLLFHARFTDVAAPAVLRAPVIFGPPDHMDYILESMGCIVAFLDYDSDGWLDIFLLSGRRRERPVKGATNRLYKNNRGRHLHRRDRKGWSDAGASDLSAALHGTLWPPKAKRATISGRP
jgi:enediyne biosynthesis protein E4